MVTCLGPQALHRYFRCLAYDQSNSRLVVVAEDGRACKAKTSQQLAAALSVSVWDIRNLNQPLLLCTAGSKQVYFSMTQCVCACPLTTCSGEIGLGAFGSLVH